MTVHIPQPSLREAVALVVEIAQQFDADRLSEEQRTNAAVSYVIERQCFPWPLALQRQILAQATAALRLETSEETGEPSQEVAPEPAPDDAFVLGQTVEDEPFAVEPEPVAAMPVEDPATTAPDTTPTQVDMPSPSSDAVHKLLEALDIAELDSKPPVEQETLIHGGIETFSTSRKENLNAPEVAEQEDAVPADMIPDLGPLEALMADEDVTDIMVNGPHQIFAERGGKLELTQLRFCDDEHVITVANRIVAAVGQRIDSTQPIIDARLADGSCVNIILPPLAIDGPTITIRRDSSAPLKFEQLVESGSLSVQMSRFLALAAYLRLNILVSGGGGSGKTTLLNAMSKFIPEGERIVTIEDAAELRFQQEHVVRFQTRPPNVEGDGEVTMRTLVRNALRIRPDRIIIGEIHGNEVLDLVQAMNTGHDGSMSTVQANSPAEALTRVERMGVLDDFADGGSDLRRQLADAVHLIVHTSRMSDGKRRVTSISELAGLSGDAITLQELFSFVADPESTRTRVTGKHVYSGCRPGFFDRAAEYGVAAELEEILGTL